VASLLAKEQIPFRVLNARNDHLEAAIVAQAGALGSVTVSTNMAGRGTDIRLGGGDGRDAARVGDLGGLYVLGTNRHESRRIDNQLRGRAGRQGDQGETRFIVSGEDDLFRRHGVDDLFKKSVAWSAGALADEAHIGKTIAHVQRVIEGESFEIRRTLWKYSYCLERQRREVYDHRRRLLCEFVAPNRLKEIDPELYEKLAAMCPVQTLATVERQVTLCVIDRCWSDHLARVAEIRDGIHLISLGGLDAFDEFNRQINAAFREFWKQIDDQVLATLRAVKVTSAGIDLKNEGLLGPSSTWTYMINDNPAGDILQRLLSGMKRMFEKQP
jgi:preprotein translocase subunit SecA